MSKKKFISWMWKSREDRIKNQFHPRHLINFLENNNVSEDNNSCLDMFLKQWHGTDDCIEI